MKVGHFPGQSSQEDEEESACAIFSHKLYCKVVHSILIYSVFNDNVYELKNLIPQESCAVISSNPVNPVMTTVNVCSCKSLAQFSLQFAHILPNYTKHGVV